MATLVLSAVGASIDGAVGGSVFGLSSAVLGRAVGATIGRYIDQQVLGSGSAAVPTGKIDRFRLTGATEGATVPKVFGRVRVGGQVIWASRFREEIHESGGSGKGGSGTPKTSRYGYSVSLALALGEGEVTSLGRIWADGVEVSRDQFQLRFYPGDDTQLPDPKIEAVEGAGTTPAFRGTAYVVFEDLDLEPFGNRVPQFSFEIYRRAQTGAGSSDPAALISGVALIPGSGEYALATTPVHYSDGPGQNRSANVNSPSGQTDFTASMQRLREDVSGIRAASLVVTWFGDDLRAGQCTVQPKVEQAESDGVGMPWTVSGRTRSGAAVVSDKDGRPIFGGTPADASVIEAIEELNAGGQEVMFYPFVMMDIQTENGLTDPWSGASDQPVVPWRGRITTDMAPGQAGSTDGTAAAEAEVSAFFGAAQVSDFTQTGDGVAYAGPAEWSYRRFVLHYAHLCAVAGGVESFCIGSELRALTQIRGAGNSFPVVDALVQLAADVRQILGPNTKISYAADWSEYFGYHPQDGSGDVYFHLDALWADANIDFIGIDNYMPLSDWRDEPGHADEGWRSIYALDYLKSNIEGGEGYDWYYPSPTERDYQFRSDFTDGAYGEDWVWRYKDIRNWWSELHHNRIGGVRSENPTSFSPKSKPIRFTELGCAAIDKATNQPNVFLDAKSSESQLPYYSNGHRDDFIQFQYLRAMHEYWTDPANNPVSEVYGGAMLDMAHAYVWAWDTRPWPEFPANQAVWSDGENYARGHWLNGRIGAQALSDIIAEICGESGVAALAFNQCYGAVRGYLTADVDTARAKLQPLLLTYGIDAAEEDGVVHFRKRAGVSDGAVPKDALVWTGENLSEAVVTRQPEAELAGEIRLQFIRSDGSYEADQAEAVFPDDTPLSVATTEVPIVLSGSEASAIAQRWLAESRVSRDSISFALPPSIAGIGVGDVLDLPASLGGGLVRVEKIEEQGERRVDAVRVDRQVYRPLEGVNDEGDSLAAFVPPVPVFPLFLDLPLISGDENPIAPHIAVAATPWPGSAALYSSPSDDDYSLNTLVERSATIGVTQTALPAADTSVWDNGPPVRVQFGSGAVQSADKNAVLNGANIVAIGSGQDDDWEIFQFADATLVGENTYDLSTRLRGQAGTDGLMPDFWPVGSYVVVLNAVPEQITLSQSARGLARHYRVGPAGRPYSDASYLHEVRAFSGVGLRPYAPSHIRADLQSNGDYAIHWIRRTRIDGDSWEGIEVPLGEVAEQYRLRIRDAGGALVRETDTFGPAFLYSAATRASDGITGAFNIEVAQISDRFGAGLFRKVLVDE